MTGMLIVPFDMPYLPFCLKTVGEHLSANALSWDQVTFFVENEGLAHTLIHQGIPFWGKKPSCCPKVFPLKKDPCLDDESLIHQALIEGYRHQEEDQRAFDLARGWLLFRQDVLYEEPVRKRRSIVPPYRRDDLYTRRCRVRLRSLPPYHDPHHAFLESLKQQWQIDPPSHPVVMLATWGVQGAWVHRWMEEMCLYPQGIVLIQDKNTVSSSQEVQHVDTPSALLKEILNDRPFDHGLDTALVGWSMAEYTSPRSEAEGVAQRVRTWLMQGSEAHDITVVVTDEELRRHLVHALKKHEIFYHRPTLLLRETVLGTWIQHVIACLFDSSILNFLSFLKHPWTRWGYDTQTYLRALESFEYNVIRNPEMPLHTYDAVVAQGIEDSGPLGVICRALRAWVRDLHFATTLGDIFNMLSYLLEESLKRGEGDKGADPARAYERDLTQQWITSLGKQVACAQAHVAPPRIQTFFKALIFSTLQTPIHQSNRKGISLKTASEARLQGTNKMIVMGLETQKWYAPSPPSLGDHLRATLRSVVELPDLTLQAAHTCQLDIYDWASVASEVFMTRSFHREGRSSAPSSLWVKIHNAGVAGLPVIVYDPVPPQRYSRSECRPTPCPPQALRPRKVSVTAFETCLHDPYRFYARWILKLKEPNALTGQSTSLIRGILMHTILHELAQRWPQHLDISHARIQSHLERMIHDPLERVWLEPKLIEMVQTWFQEHASDSSPPQAIFSEHQGSWVYETPEGPFTLIARADRVDSFQDGRLRIVDYKTGTVPSQKAMRQGVAPQLLLEGLIARSGGFIFQKALTLPPHLHSLEIWSLRRTAFPFEKVVLDTDLSTLVDHVQIKLQDWIETYSRADTPYRAYAIHGKYDPYRTLKRVEEWITST